MAGHSQFKNIMYRKGAQDRRRAAVFAKLSREITVAARLGGSDISMNSQLRLVVKTARAQNMPRENVERAIKKATGDSRNQYEANLYEGYGPGGVGVLVETLSDNRNRTSASLRMIFAKNGGNLAEKGSVFYMFARVGEISYPPEASSASQVMEAAITAEADDVDSHDSGHTIFCSLDRLAQIAEILENMLGPAQYAKRVWKPQILVTVDAEKLAAMMKLIEALEEDEDVQQVHANLDAPDFLLANAD